MALQHLTLLWKFRMLARHPVRTARVFLDADTPWVAKLLPLAAGMYAVLPLDILPDIFPILGWFDDATVLIILSAYALARIPDSVYERHNLDPQRIKIDATSELP